MFEFSTDGNIWTAADGVMDGTVPVVDGLMVHTDVGAHSFSFALQGCDSNPAFQFRMLAVWDPILHYYVGTSDPLFYNPAYAIHYENVIVSGTRVPPPQTTVRYVADVPDANQPCANPLNVNGFTDINVCAPTSALNITEYWDNVRQPPIATAVDVDGLPNPGPTSVLQFVAWWMNTNDDHAWDAQNGRCPYRLNGFTENPNTGDHYHFNGTAMKDCAAGLAQYVRWDDTHDFWANPPALLAGKEGYDWTVELFEHDLTVDPDIVWHNGWNAIKSEIDAGRPLIAVWQWWNPVNPNRKWGDGLTYCDLGPNVDPPVETLVGGHAVTVVGYIHDGAGGPGRVVVHDNWWSTDRDVVMKWKEDGLADTKCKALVRINPFVAPSVGTVTSSRGDHDPPDKTVNPGSAPVMAQIVLTGCSTEDVAVNAIKLTASGSGNDRFQIAEIDLVWDVNDDGIADTLHGDIPLAIHNGGYPNNDATLILRIPGDSTFVIPKSAPPLAPPRLNLLVVYHISPFCVALSDFRLHVDDIMATGCKSHLRCVVTNGYGLSSTVTCGIPLYNVAFRIGNLKSMTDGIVCHRWYDFLFAENGSGEPLDDLVITNCTTGFYVQEIDGSAGIRLMFQTGPPAGAAPGMRLLVDGITWTAQGERVIMVTSAQVTTNAPQRVVGMPVRSVGGGDWYWDIITHAGQQGVEGGVGLNNIGLLVRTWGRYTKVDSTTFTLDDGSGVPLKCVVPMGVTLEDGWTYVVATGVSSMEMIDDHFYPILRLRMRDDVLPM